MFELYPQYEYNLAQIQLIFFMLGMGATLSLSDFAPVFRQPRDLSLGLTYQLILMPFLALAFIYLADLTEGNAVGLILLGALPGGTLSNVFTYLSRGNVALSIALSATAAFLSMGTIPLVLRFLAYEHVPPEFQMPIIPIVSEILLCMMLPLSVGMLIARFQTKRASMISRICLRVGFFFVLVMIIGSLGSGQIEPGRYGWGMPLLIIFFCLLMQQLSMLPHRLLGWPEENYVAIGIEVTFRNIFLGLLLKAILFPGATAIGKDVLFMILFYGAVSMVIGSSLTFRMQRVIRKKQAKALAEASS